MWVLRRLLCLVYAEGQHPISGGLLFAVGNNLNKKSEGLDMDTSKNIKDLVFTV